MGVGVSLYVVPEILWVIPYRRQWRKVPKSVEVPNRAWPQLPFGVLREAPDVPLACERALLPPRDALANG